MGVSPDARDAWMADARGTSRRSTLTQGENVVTISISVEGASGTTWERLAIITELMEASSLHRLFVSDHLVGPIPPDFPNVEALMSLAYVANRTSRVGFGTQVAPLTLRDPVLLVRQATALHQLSGGRMVLGVGAGWNEREHTMFGYPFGTARDRARRLDEGLTVMRGLLRGEGRFSFDGQVFHVADALLSDAGIPGSLPILVGGGHRTLILPLVAKHADIWGAQMLSPEEFADRNALLDTLLVGAGRDPGTVPRVLLQGILCGTEEQIAEMLRRVPIFPPDMAVAERRAFFETVWHYVVGTPEDVHARLMDYVRAGVDEFVVQWFNFFGIEDRKQIGHEIAVLESLMT